MDVDFVGLGASADMLLDAAARGEDMRPAMAQVKELFIGGHKKNFDSRGVFFDKPWPDNSPETVARKGREGVPSLMSVMVAGGDLEQALAGGKGSRSRVSKGSVSVGVSLIAALFSQGGASGGRRGDQPARPVVGVPESERQTALRIITRFLTGRRR
jgi:hypothetical protein